MISWLAENIGTIVAALAVIAVVCIAVAVMMKDKKKGKSSCGNHCAHCAMAGQCHKTK